MEIRPPNIRWPRILAGRLILRACRSGRLTLKDPGCDCGPTRRCPLQTYCRAANMERTAAARIEKWFWGVLVGATATMALYAMLTWT